MCFEMKQMNAAAASYPHMALTQPRCHSLFSMMVCDQCAAEGRRNRSAETLRPTGLPRLQLCCYQRPIQPGGMWHLLPALYVRPGVPHWVNISQPLT